MYPVIKQFTDGIAAVEDYGIYTLTYPTANSLLYAMSEPLIHICFDGGSLKFLLTNGHFCYIVDVSDFIALFISFYRLLQIVA